MKIWKFELELMEIQSMMMPAGAEVLSVGNQSGNLCLWAMVDPEAPLEMREFEVIGTGNTMEPDIQRRYLGTVQMPPFVWHVFEAE